MDNSDSDFELDILAMATATLLKIHKKKKRRARRQHWVNPYLKGRLTKGRYYKDFQDLSSYPQAFRENFHMSLSAFNTLHHLIKDKLSPKPHSRKDSISSEEKLCLTLEFLASGTIQRHMASVYRISKCRVGLIVEETCEAIYQILRPAEFGNFNSNQWLETSNKFNQKWNLPNCLGAIDGKHVGIKCPQNAGFHSIVLMAVADAEYRFLYSDIGAYGSEGDSTVFRESAFGMKVINDDLNFPPDATLLSKKIPFYFIGDDAFPLRKRILKPFSPRDKAQLTAKHRIFNYRLSRARRCVENAFGILCSRWGCLARTMFVGPTRAQKIVAACVALHNFLMDVSKEIYCPEEFADAIFPDGRLREGSWRKNVSENSCLNRPLITQNSGRQPEAAKVTREIVCEYVNSDVGSVSWQNEMFF